MQNDSSGRSSTTMPSFDILSGNGNYSPFSNRHIESWNSLLADDYAGDAGFYHIYYTWMQHPTTAAIQDVLRANKVI